jgi:RNA polymerase sigma-70 factor (ECF subfamily)
VWVHLLHGLNRNGWHFPDRGSLLALLTTMTRRRLVSRYRTHRAALRCEQSTTADGVDVAARCQPRPSELAQAEELWERMLALCPPAHHEVLRLKRQGFRLQEIADRTGFHEGSVRRILRQLTRALALQSGAVPDPVVA